MVLKRSVWAPDSDSGGVEPDQALWDTGQNSWNALAMSNATWGQSYQANQIKAVVDMYVIQASSEHVVERFCRNRWESTVAG